MQFIRLSLKRKYKYQNKAKHSMTKVNEKNMIFKSLHNDFGLLDSQPQKLVLL